jgi:hypothetical protein
MRKALFQGLISIFLGNEEQEARQNTESFDTTGIQEVLLPSFADKLRLLLSVKIPTQNEPAGTHELNRTKLYIPEGRVRLEEHILSTDLWALDVVVKVIGASTHWCWTPPPGGKFSMCAVANNGEEMVWKQFRRSVSRLQIEATAQRADFSILI